MSIPPATGICRPEHALWSGGVVSQHIADVAGFPTSVADSVSRVRDLELRQLFHLAIDGVREPAKQPTTICRRDLTPRFERTSSTVDRGVRLTQGPPVAPS